MSLHLIIFSILFILSFSAISSSESSKVKNNSNDEILANILNESINWPVKWNNENNLTFLNDTQIQLEMKSYDYNPTSILLTILMFDYENWESFEELLSNCN